MKIRIIIWALLIIDRLHPRIVWVGLIGASIVSSSIVTVGIRLHLSLVRVISINDINFGLGWGNNRRRQSSAFAPSSAEVDHKDNEYDETDDSDD